jgi:hypothetical protein
MTLSNIFKNELSDSSKKKELNVIEALYDYLECYFLIFLKI